MANNDMTATVKDQADSIFDHFTDVVDVVDVGHDKPAGMKHRLVEAKGVVVDKAGSMVKTVIETIKAHRLIAVGAALAVGYVAMRLIRRD